MEVENARASQVLLGKPLQARHRSRQNLPIEVDHLQIIITLPHRQIRHQGGQVCVVFRSNLLVNFWCCLPGVHHLSMDGGVASIERGGQWVFCSFFVPFTVFLCHIPPGVTFAITEPHSLRAFCYVSLAKTEFRIDLSVRIGL